MTFLSIMESPVNRFITLSCYTGIWDVTHISDHRGDCRPASPLRPKRSFFPLTTGIHVALFVSGAEDRGGERHSHPAQHDSPDSPLVWACGGVYEEAQAAQMGAV